MQGDLAKLRLIATGLDHAECVTVGPDGLLYAGGEAGQIYRVSAEGGELEDVANIGGLALGLCCDAHSAVYVCDAGNLRVVRVAPDGSVSTYCESAGGDPLVCPNYPAFTSDGAMWLSDSGADFPLPGDGRLLRVPAGGGDAEVMDLRPLNFSNGLCVAPDDTLYLVESYYEPGVVAYREGVLTDYVRIPRTVPDGVAIAESGALYVSCYQPNAIFRVPPGGASADLFLEDWMGQRLLTPTNVAFFGQDLGSLAIASFCGYDIKAIETPDRGLPLHYPEI